MKSVLENPDEFFNNLTDKQFKHMLDEFGIKYDDMNKYPESIQEISQYLQNIKIRLYMNRNKYISDIYYYNNYKRECEKYDKQTFFDQIDIYRSTKTEYNIDYDTDISSYDMGLAS